MVTFGIVNSTILMKLSLSRRGVVDGERPLKLSRSKFGISTEILDLYLYLTFWDIFSRLPEKQIPSGI